MKKLVQQQHYFEETEGIDIHPAAAVATATLIETAKNGFNKNALIMLNITGGGEKRFKHEKKLYYLKPDIVFDINPNPELVEEKINELFGF